MNFCDKCNKLVPDKEVKDFVNEHKIHLYTITVNAYKNQPKGMIGCLLVDELVFCGKIREPSAEEYFIYHTLGKGDS